MGTVVFVRLRWAEGGGVFEAAGLAARIRHRRALMEDEEEDEDERKKE